MKLCIHCKHYSLSWEMSAKCTHENSIHNRSPVDGSFYYTGCALMRLKDAPATACGEEARLFEEMPAPPVVRKQARKWWRLW